MPEGALGAFLHAGPLTTGGMRLRSRRHLLQQQAGAELHDA